MSSPLKKILLVLCPVAAAVAATTQFSPDRPVINFRLPTFTPEGHRSWLVRGSEARFINENKINVKGLTLTIFSGLADGRVETMMLSPSAEVLPADSVITGQETIRVINDEFEATGVDWRYNHQEKRVSINQNVHVTFRAELKAILK